MTGVPAGRSRRRLAIVCLALVATIGGASPRPVEAQITAQSLIGKAVSDDAQAKDIDNAIARFRERDIDGCLAMLERARSLNPQLPPPGVMMAVLWLSVNQLQPARAELEATAVRFPQDPEPYLMLGDIAFQERRITESAVLFEKAAVLAGSFDENPKRRRDFEIRASAGNAAVAEARRQWEQARTQLARWLELDPENASAHQRMGIVAFKLGQEQEALVRFREARALDPNAVQPELGLARLYDDAKKKDIARTLVEKAVKASPDDASVQLAAAQWYLAQNDLDKARAGADAALAIDPRSLEGKIVRGAVARMARDYTAAERSFEEAHVQSPGNFVASNSLALVLIESDDRDARQRAMEMAEANVAMHRDNSPQQVNALTTLAWVYYRMGRREDAERILEQISRSNALTSDGAYYVAKLLADRGDKARARKILDEVLDSEPMFATRPDAADLRESLGRESGD